MRLRQGPTPLLLLAGLLPLVLFVAMAWFDYRLEAGRARDQVAATTDALAEHAQKVVETADLVLARVLDHVDAMDWQTIGSSRDVHEFLAGLKRELPQLESVFLVSPEGINSATSRMFPLPKISDGRRDYFVHAQAGGRGVFVSEPFRGQLDGTFAFTITRPRLRQGRFDGLAGITISSTYFESFYRSLSARPGAAATALLRDDGTLLVRSPALPDNPVRLPPSSTLLEAVSSGADAGIIAGRSPFGGDARLAGFRHLANVPLLVSYSIDASAYLREWYLHLVLFAILAALASVTILVAGRAMLSDAAQKQLALQQLVEETGRRQKAEAALQQSQKMEALGRLTGGLAHDFNNLLTAILGSLDLLQKHVSEPRPARLLSTARKAAARGAQLTAQMLAFARRQEVALRPVDIGAAIRGMNDMLRGAVGPLARVNYDISAGMWPAVADPVQFEVSLLNLVVNARDAMPNGGELTISAAPVTVGGASAGLLDLVSGEYVRVSVSDTGEGMPEDVRARALEPFFTTKGPGRGTGLGLSMVFGFASLTGGTMTLESTRGQGTTVSLYLPRATAGATGAAEPAPDPRDGARARAKVRVLLVDDDEAVRSTTRLMLEELTHDVVEADSAGAALGVLKSDRRFGLVMIDFAMPRMNGGELATAIRKMWPDAPLLFVTGYVDNDALRGWTELGVPTLNKPFSQSDLAHAVTSATERAQPTARIIPFRA